MREIVLSPIQIKELAFACYATIMDQLKAENANKNAEATEYEAPINNQAA